MKNMLVLLVLSLFVTTVLSGCQTWQGLGRDIETLGRKMQ